MAPKKLLFSENGQQTPLIAAEESDTSSDSDGGRAVKKPKFGPEPGDNGSACSSPTASGFIIMPAQKPEKKKKNPVSKKFSNEDEIALLKGLDLFWANGRNNKWAEFHTFIKNDLNNRFSKIQVSEKIRSLRKKFERARANGGRLDFSDSHELLVFELSKKVWGDDDGIAEGNRKIVEENKGLDAADVEIAQEVGKIVEKSNQKSRKNKGLGASDEEIGQQVGKITEEVGEIAEGLRNKSRKNKIAVKTESNNKLRKNKRLDAADEEIVEEVGKFAEESNKSRKTKRLDAPGEEKRIGDEYHEENDLPEKGKQVKESKKGDFESDFPLLYASFDKFGFPKLAKEKCVLIPREKAQELEEKWRELNADALRLELKRIELIKMDLLDHLQTK